MTDGYIVYKQKCTACDTFFTRYRYSYGVCKICKMTEERYKQWRMKKLKNVSV